MPRLEVPFVVPLPSEAQTAALPPLGGPVLLFEDDGTPAGLVDQPQSPVEVRDRIAAQEIVLKARDDVAGIMARIGARFYSLVAPDRAPIMRELTETDWSEWIAAEVDAIEAKIVDKRGPYTPSLTFLPESESTPEPEPVVAPVPVEKPKPVRKRPSPRPRAPKPTEVKAS